MYNVQLLKITNKAPVIVNICQPQHVMKHVKRPKSMKHFFSNIFLKTIWTCNLLPCILKVHHRALGKFHKKPLWFSTIDSWSFISFTIDSCIPHEPNQTQKNYIAFGNFRQFQAIFETPTAWPARASWIRWRRITRFAADRLPGIGKMERWKCPSKVNVESKFK